MHGIIQWFLGSELGSSQKLGARGYQAELVGLYKWELAVRGTHKLTHLTILLIMPRHQVSPLSLQLCGLKTWLQAGVLFRKSLPMAFTFVLIFSFNYCVNYYVSLYFFHQEFILQSSSLFHWPRPHLLCALQSQVASCARLCQVFYPTTISACPLPSCGLSLVTWLLHPLPSTHTHIWI